MLKRLLVQTHGTQHGKRAEAWDKEHGRRNRCNQVLAQSAASDLIDHSWREAFRRVRVLVAFLQLRLYVQMGAVPHATDCGNKNDADHHYVAIYILAHCQPRIGRDRPISHCPNLLISVAPGGVR